MSLDEVDTVGLVVDVSDAVVAQFLCHLAHAAGLLSWLLHRDRLLCL